MYPATLAYGQHRVKVDTTTLQTMVNTMRTVLMLEAGIIPAMVITVVMPVQHTLDRHIPHQTVVAIRSMTVTNHVHVHVRNSLHQRVHTAYPTAVRQPVDTSIMAVRHAAPAPAGVT